uniref:tetratricopeptide repeat protein 29-like n=1 Tax=Halichoerus grypus TaxID=9711 RepID=UPI001659BF45|nr:tetratricopeptide repeat protein 29-like [Halichoerus grypus]
MLRDGYHKSFSELFALMEKWDALRETARVRSLLWLQRPLEEQPDKLDHFYHYLTRAEAAERKEYFEGVYNNLYALACYFNNSEDKWVRNYFYERCFKIAQLIKIDGGKKEAEAHAHMGLLFEEDGQLLEAAEHYEAFHQLTQGRVWKDETGRFLNLLACESLLRTYRLLSDKMLENKEYKQAIRILIKASEIAKEGSDKKMEGEASYYLGLAHLAAGEYETALTVLNTYSKISTDLDDDLSLGRAYEAIAKVLQRDGFLIMVVLVVVVVSSGKKKKKNRYRLCQVLIPVFQLICVTIITIIFRTSLSLEKETLYASLPTPHITTPPPATNLLSVS